MTDEDFNKLIMEQMRDVITKQNVDVVEKLIIDSIIEIYNNEFICYEEYYSAMIRRINEVRFLNEKNFEREGSRINYIAEPIILKRSIFDYIKRKR